MIKKIISAVTAAIIVLSVSATAAFARDLKIIEAIGDYPRPQPEQQVSKVSTLGVSFLRASEALKKNQPVILEVSFTNVPDSTYAVLQWTQDGTPLENGYYSNFGLYNGATVSFTGVLPYYGEAGTTTSVGLDIAIDGVLRRETVTIPFAAGTYIDDSAQSVLSKVQPMVISGTVNSGTATYSDRSLKNKAGYVNSGTNVYYIDHNDDISCYIDIPGSGKYWIPFANLSVPSKNLTESGDFTTSEKETFVNASEYSSTTPYLIWVNLKHQKVNIFMGQKGSWKLQKSFTCASGANKTPTPTGTYKYCGKDTAWIKPEYQVRPVLYFDIGRGLAFHSRLYSPDGKYLTDSTMGRPVSHGCIRMMDDDIRWMELYMTFGTTVVVY